MRYFYAVVWPNRRVMIKHAAQLVDLALILRGRVLILQTMDVILMRIVVAHVLVDKTLEMLVRLTIIAKRVEDLARLVRAI